MLTVRKKRLWSDIIISKCLIYIAKENREKCRTLKGCMNFHIKGVSLMKIFVGLKNGKLDSVPDYLLGMMIAAGEVTSILRSTGWVQVGVDPVRKGESGFCYYGPERRNLIQRRLCHNCPYFIEGECTNEVCHIRYIQFSSHDKE
jgi:hypothetical protein